MRVGLGFDSGATFVPMDLPLFPLMWTFSPMLASLAPTFGAALLGTSKILAMGALGAAFVRWRWLDDAGLRVLGQLVGLLTLPCLIFYRFATRFDPQTLPGWWKYALGGSLVTLIGLGLGRLLSRRWGGNDETTLLVGYQNAGFFVLPMMQTLLSPAQYERGSLLLFLVFIPFNATLWFAGSWFLLGHKSFDWRRLLTPTFCATLGTLLLYGPFHAFLHRFDASFLMQVLLGTPANRSGALQLIGDMTVPLSTFALGGSVAVALRDLSTQPAAPTMLTRRDATRAAAEISALKLVGMPLCGLALTPFLLRWLGASGDPTVTLLFCLQWAAPPAASLASFAEQHGYRMTLIPLACLFCYALCLLTVPLWVALFVGKL